jgi:hypothetical protein
MSRKAIVGVNSGNSNICGHYAHLMTHNLINPTLTTNSSSKVVFWMKIYYTICSLDAMSPMNPSFSTDEQRQVQS